MRLTLIILVLLFACLARWKAWAATQIIHGPIVTPPLLLNSTTNQPWAAYSVARKLWSAYTGAAFRVRRDNDDAEQDIGFSGTLINTASLTSFVGANSGFVSTIYDQFGNGRNLTNTTTTVQPKIVNAGAILVDDNGYPRAEFDGSDDLLIFGSAPGTLPITYFAVVSSDTHVGNDALVMGSSGASPNTMALKQDTTGQEYLVNNGLQPDTDYPDYTLGTEYLLTIYCESGTSDSIQQNNLTKTTGEFGANLSTSLRAGHATVCADYNFSEWVVYDQAVTGTDLTTLQDNINAFYTLW